MACGKQQSPHQRAFFLATFFVAVVRGGSCLTVVFSAGGMAAAAPGWAAMKARTCGYTCVRQRRPLKMP
jgi:hypothetical protein